MKSRVLRAADYRGTELEVPRFQPDYEAVEKEFERLARRNAGWAEGGAASAGDIAECRLESSLPRFSKERVRVVVGSGMFDRRVEDALLGRMPGESFALELDGAAVSVSVLSVKNRVAREPDDSMAAALGIEGVETLDDYAGRIIQAQRSEAFDSVLRDMLFRIRDAVISGSEFQLCKEDWAYCVKLELDYCRAVAALEGLKLEEMTPEQFAWRVPVKSYYELVAMLQDSAWEKLCEGLLGRYYAAADGFDVTEAEYEAQAADYAKEWRLSAEAARAVFSPEYFRMNAWSEHAYSVWKEYIAERYYAVND